jgi:CheY-like chemotaxis protein
MPRILIAEPSPASCVAYCLSLSDCGYQIESAATAEECATCLDRFAPDVLILDLQLPCNGASRILNRLHRLWATQLVPPVVLIGDDSSQSITGIILTSPLVEAYFQRPICFSSLEEVIRCAATTAGRRASNEHRRFHRATRHIETKPAEIRLYGSPQQEHDEAKALPAASIGKRLMEVSTTPAS